VTNCHVEGGGERGKKSKQGLSWNTFVARGEGGKEVQIHVSLFWPTVSKKEKRRKGGKRGKLEFPVGSIFQFEKKKKKRRPTRALLPVSE